MASTYFSESIFNLMVELTSKINCEIFSYIIEQQSCFLTLTEMHFSKRDAYAFLDDLAQVLSNI